MIKRGIGKRFSVLLTASLIISPPLFYSNRYRSEMTQRIPSNSEERILQLKIQKKEYLLPKPHLAECRIPPSAALTHLESTPSGHSIKQQKYPGYPSPAEYADVTSLQWNPNIPSYHRARTAVYQNGYDYHTRYFPTFQQGVDSTITSWFQDALLPLPPILEWIRGEPVTVLATQYGEIIAWQPVLAYKKWSKQLPVNETVISTFATYTDQNRIFLLVATDRKILYQLDLETGREERRISLEETIQSPLQIGEMDNQVLLVYKGEEHIYGWNVLQWKLLFQKQETSFTDLSPFVVQIHQQTCIVQPFNSGRIISLSLSGETLWELDTTGPLHQDLSLLVRDGTPFLVTAPDSSLLLLVQADTGIVLSRKELPGRPISPVVFEPAFLSVSLVVETKQGITGFFSTDFEEPKHKDTWCPIPLHRCLAIYGFHLEKEPNYLLINEKLEWMVVEKGLRKLSEFYPSPLTRSEKAITTLPRVPGALVQGALLLNLGSSGFCMLGHPIPQDPLQAGEYRHTGATQDRSSVEPPYSNQSSRKEMDTLPDYTKKRAIQMSIPHPGNLQPLLNPLLWVDKMTGRSYCLILSSPDTLTILDDQLKIKFSLSLGFGSALTEPILEQEETGELMVWAVTDKALLEARISPDFQKSTVTALAVDVGSKGGSFLKSSHSTGFNLIWVDDQNQLVVFSMPKRQIRYKVIVDSKNIALQSWDGEQYLFCGSKVIRFRDGEVISRHGIYGSSSTVIPFQGRLYWIQSTEDDIICKDGIQDETLWFVRRLWCKSHCFFQSNPSVLADIQSGFVVVADYTRILSIDLSRGYIRWSYPSRDDIFLSQPTIIRTPSAFLVYAGSLRGKLYAWQADTGELVRGFPLPLPGKEEPKEIMKGASTPILTNGALWIQRKEYGLVQYGSPIPSSLDLPLIQFRLQKKIPSPKNFSSWIRTILYWDTFFSFSNRLKLVW